jgi:hypothetical protein
MKYFVKLAVFLLFSLLSWASISRTGECSAQSTTCTLTASNIGDLVVVVAFGNAGTITLPGGWTQIATNTAGTLTFLAACEESTGSTAIGTWTNAGEIVAVSYAGTAVGNSSNCNTTGVGGINEADSASGSTSISCQGITMSNSSGSSWVACLEGLLVNEAGCTPAGMTAFASSVNRVIGNDTNGGVTSWSTTACSVGTTTKYWTFTAEILAFAPHTLTLTGAGRS